jgi:hypothetical protein
MAGAGHQHFLGFMRNIIATTTAEHLRKTLFDPWRYDDPVQNATLRWDPADDSRYALQWRNPSGDPSRRSSGSMLGANRLAIEGLPLLPTSPQSFGLATTGFRGRKSSDTFWTWPVWSIPLDLHTVRSLLAHSELQADQPNHEILRSIGSTKFSARNGSRLARSAISRRGNLYDHAPKNELWPTIRSCDPRVSREHRPRAARPGDHPGWRGRRR